MTIIEYNLTDKHALTATRRGLNTIEPYRHLPIVKDYLNSNELIKNSFII